MNSSRHILLSEVSAGTVRFLSGIHVILDEGRTQSWVTVTRTGTFNDPRYGEFEISRDMLNAMVKNFNDRVYGQDIFYDVSHEPAKGAAGKVIALKVEGDRLRALVEWTPYGIDAIKNKGYAYSSIEYQENFKDNESGKEYGPVMLGAGLVVRPCIKRLDPIQLSEASGGNVPTLMHPELQSKLLQEIQAMFKKLIEDLKKKCAELNLDDGVIQQLIAMLQGSMEPDADEKACSEALGKYISLAETIAKQVGNKPVQLNISAPAVKTLSEADITRILAEREAAQAAASKKLAEGKANNIKLLSDTINAATGIDDETKKELSEAVVDLITPEMNADQVKRLAESQIAMGNKLAVAKQLSAVGYTGSHAGVIHVAGVEGEVKKLSSIYHDNLKKTSTFSMGKIKLAENTHPFVSMVLAEYDRLHAYELHSEVKMLAGETGMANTSLPVGFVREVIREALSDLNVLSLVNTMVDSTATSTTQIPYEQRDVSQVFNDGIVYEGQEIHRAGISQAMDSAYIVPMKIAIMVSNEVVHFTRASGINWDAMARSLEYAARFMRELVTRRIANEMQRSADAYGAISVTGEAFDAQLTGTNSIIKTVNYPIVRPHQVRDLQGNAIGNAEHPIALVLNGTAISAYDGTGKQTAGTYYRVINYNLGYVQLVNETGTPVTPSDTGVNTIGYSKATNIVKVDLDVPTGSTLEKQLNKALQAIGARKALLSGDRYVVPDFQLMSPTLNDTLTNAEQFTEIGQRQDANVSTQGDLTTVKGIPAFGTNAPGIDLGDERIIIGQRGVAGYTIAKPFAFRPPFEAVGPNGQPIGKMQSYGEEYNAIKVPTPVRDRFTSVLVYSFTGR